MTDGLTIHVTRAVLDTLEANEHATIAHWLAIHLRGVEPITTHRHYGRKPSRVCVVNVDASTIRIHLEKEA